jgi:hypothetical protein
MPLPPESFARVAAAVAVVIVVALASVVAVLTAGVLLDSADIEERKAAERE